MQVIATLLGGFTMSSMMIEVVSMLFFVRASIITLLAIGGFEPLLQLTHTNRLVCVCVSCLDLRGV